ncbi:MAG TPA: amidase [Gemmatimonadales bacterium]|jgi:Asp-tRNA(Asn)/Glu-tRNA(Gln) amidotransferase A subunit family amidase
MSTLVDRRSFLAACAAVGLPLDFSHQLWAETAPGADDDAVVALDPITKEQIAAAENVLGLSWRDKDRDLMLRGLQRNLAGYAALHAIPMSNVVPPAFHFDPVPVGKEPVGQPHRAPRAARSAPAAKRPTTESDWAYAGVATLSRLIHSRAVTSRQLVERSLARIEKYNPELLAVITPTRERALEQADRMDAEAKAGKFRGPLHGIPYGAKDLFAVPKYPTTWGSPIYKDQVLDVTAAVVERLDAAGAVLVAKTSLGEFAQDDTWFGGQTKNPWNTAQGSSGSSAGSASGVSAGLYPFAIGTETQGSIISPSTRCGVSGLRPTYGRVSRYGAMALSWTMDKIGPIARSAEDLALVFAAINGADPRDPSTRTMPFEFDPALPLASIRIGVPQNMMQPPDTAAMRAAAASGGGGAGGGRGRGGNPAAAMANYQATKTVLDALAKQGAKFVPITWPTEPSTNALSCILNVEAGAAFADITRDNTVDKMVLQDANAWPTTFRSATLVSAVDYVLANRARTLLINHYDDFFKDVDIVVGGGNLGATNLTGHPQVVAPLVVREGAAANDPGNQGISFVAALYREDLLLRLAHAWQTASDIHTRRPPKFS